MADLEKPKNIVVNLPDDPEDVEPQKGLDQIVQRLHEALKSKEGKDTLYRVGDLMYESFRGKEYSPQNVLASIRKVYSTHKSDFNPKLSFHQFIASFGPGMVKLCQQKLQEIGGYNLGRTGESSDGVDGKFGKKTKKALNAYYSKTEDPEQQTAKVINPEEITVTRVSYQPPSIPERYEGSAIEPYRRGTEKGTFTPLSELAPSISAIYGENETTYDNKKMYKVFGKNKAEVMKFNITEDPLTQKPVSFMGKPLTGGINMEMYVFLKVAEAEIQKLNLKYVPNGESIGGFEYRRMKMIDGSDNGMSMHAYGAIDIDAGANSPKSGRGDIPDEVVMALVNAGLAWGGARDKAFSYLGRDPMHFQTRFPADSPQGQSIINASPVGRKYWSVIGPMLAKKHQEKLKRENPANVA